MNDLSHISFRGSDAPPDDLGRRGGVWRRAPSPAPGTGRGPRGRDRATRADPVLGWMLGQAGLDLRAYRPSALQRRLPTCLRQLRATSAEAARALLERRPELLPQALNAILLGVSGFFRDPAVFEHLRTVVLPALLRDRPGLRVCSVGASGGQELYSVAMLLAELDALRGSMLTGIDCRSDAIARATRAVFRTEEVACMAPGRRWRFFQPENGHWQIRPELRRQVRWETADLFSFDAPGPWDLILFRNVAIYFDAVHCVRAWERLEARLAPGGVLVTGKAEVPPASLGLACIAPSIHQKAAP